MVAVAAAAKEIGPAPAVATQTLPGEMSAIDAKNRSQAEAAAVVEMTEVSVEDQDVVDSIKAVDETSNREAQCEVIVVAAIAVVHIR